MDKEELHQQITQTFKGFEHAFGDQEGLCEAGIFVLSPRAGGFGGGRSSLN